MEEVGLGNKNRIVDLNAIKGGVRRNELKNDAQRAIFDALNTTKSNSGEADEMLDAQEIADAIQMLLEEDSKDKNPAKGDKKLAGSDIDRIFGRLGLKGLKFNVDGKERKLKQEDLFEVIELLVQSSEDVETSVVEGEGDERTIKIAFKNGAQQTINADGSQENVFTDKDGNNITTLQDKDKHYISQNTVMQNGDTENIEYKTVNGVDIPVKTTTVTDNGKTTTVDERDESMLLTRRTVDKQEEDLHTVTDYQDGRAVKLVGRKGAVQEEYIYDEFGQNPKLKHREEDLGNDLKKTTDIEYTEDGLVKTADEPGRNTVTTMKNVATGNGTALVPTEERITEGDKKTELTYKTVTTKTGNMANVVSEERITEGSKSTVRSYEATETENGIVNLPTQEIITGEAGKTITNTFDHTKGTKTETIQQGKNKFVNTYVMTEKDGKPAYVKVSQDYYSGNRKVRTVDYDGKGNTLNYVVQFDGDGPESIAAIAKKAGCSVDAIIAANKGKVQGRGKHASFRVGEYIVIPGELDGNSSMLTKMESQKKTLEKYQKYLDAKAFEKALRDAGLKTHEEAGTVINIRDIYNHKHIRVTIAGKDYGGGVIVYDKHKNIYHVDPINYATYSPQGHANMCAVPKGTKITPVWEHGCRNAFIHTGGNLTVQIGDKNYQSQIEIGLEQSRGMPCTLSGPQQIRKNDGQPYIMTVNRGVMSAAVAASGGKITSDGKPLKVTAAGQNYNVCIGNYYGSDRAGSPYAGVRNVVCYGSDGTIERDHYDVSSNFEEMTQTDIATAYRQIGTTIASDIQSAAKNSNAWYNFLGTGMGTDNEKLQTAVRGIPNNEVLNYVNEGLEGLGYHSNSDWNSALEWVLQDEVSINTIKREYAPFLINNVMTSKQGGQFIADLINYDEHGGLGITYQADLDESFSLIKTRSVRLAAEDAMAVHNVRNGVQLKDGETQIAASLRMDGAFGGQGFGAGWTQVEIDRRYALLMGVPGVYDDSIPEDWNAKTKVLNNLYFNEDNNDDGENLARGAYVASSSQKFYTDYFLVQADIYNKSHDEDEEYVKGQDPGQIFLSNRCADKNRNVDMDQLRFLDAILMNPETLDKSIISQVNAQLSVLSCKQGATLANCFESQDPDVYENIKTIIADGTEIPGCTTIQQLYDKAMKETNNDEEKTKLRVNAMASGQVQFSKDEIIKECISLMHKMDHYNGYAESTCNGSKSLTGMGAAANARDEYEILLTTLLIQHPEIHDELINRINKEQFGYTTYQTTSPDPETNFCIQTSEFHDTSYKFRDLVNTFYVNDNESIFYDENGNKITDPDQIEYIKEQNLRNLDAYRKHVATLRRDHLVFQGSEGWMEDFGNFIAESTQSGTDREDVDNEYGRASNMLLLLERAAKGQLRDKQGNVISMAQLAQGFEAQEAKLGQVNSDYKATVAEGKNYVILGGVLIVTTVATCGLSACAESGVGIGLGLSKVVDGVTTLTTLGKGTILAGSSLAAGATEFGLNMWNDATSTQGVTSVNAGQHFRSALNTGVITLATMGISPYAGKLEQTALQHVTKGGIPTALTLGQRATVTGIKIGSEALAIGAEGTIMNLSTEMFTGETAGWESYAMVGGFHLLGKMPVVFNKLYSPKQLHPEAQFGTPQSKTPHLDNLATSHTLSNGAHPEFVPHSSVKLGSEKLGNIQGEVNALCTNPTSGAELAVARRQVGGIQNRDARLAMQKQIDDAVATLPPTEQASYHNQLAQINDFEAVGILRNEGPLLPEDAAILKDYVSNHANEPDVLAAVENKLNSTKNIAGDNMQGTYQDVQNHINAAKRANQPQMSMDDLTTLVGEKRAAGKSFSESEAPQVIDLINRATPDEFAQIDAMITGDVRKNPQVRQALKARGEAIRAEKASQSHAEGKVTPAEENVAPAVQENVLPLDESALTVQKVKNGNIESEIYTDANGNVVKEIHTDGNGNVIERRYNSDGTIEEIHTVDGHTKNIFKDENGEIISTSEQGEAVHSEADEPPVEPKKVADEPTVKKEPVEEPTKTSAEDKVASSDDVEVVKVEDEGQAPKVADDDVEVVKVEDEGQAPKVGDDDVEVVKVEDEGQAPKVVDDDVKVVKVEDEGQVPKVVDDDVEVVVEENPVQLEQARAQEVERIANEAQQHVSDVPEAEMTPQEKSTWQTFKMQLANVKNMSVDEIRALGQKLVQFAKSSTQAVKTKIQTILNDLRALIKTKSTNANAVQNNNAVAPKPVNNDVTVNARSAVNRPELNKYRYNPNGSIQEGKAFTIYPRDNVHMEQVARDLDYIIRNNGLELPETNIVGDRAMGDSGRLFYRYEYNTGKVKDEVLDLSSSSDYARYKSLYDSNSGRVKRHGEGRYLADDMTVADDPWFNFNPADPHSRPDFQCVSAGQRAQTLADNMPQVKDADALKNYANQKGTAQSDFVDGNGYVAYEENGITYQVHYEDGVPTALRVAEGENKSYFKFDENGNKVSINRDEFISLKNSSDMKLKNAHMTKFIDNDDVVEIVVEPTLDSSPDVEVLVLDDQIAGLKSKYPQFSSYLDYVSEVNSIDLEFIAEAMNRYPQYAKDIAQLARSNPNIKFGIDLFNKPSNQIDRVVQTIEQHPQYHDEIINFMSVQRKGLNDTSDPVIALENYIITLDSYPQYKNFITELAKNPNLDEASLDIRTLVMQYGNNAQAMQDIAYMSSKHYTVETIQNKYNAMQQYPELRNILYSDAPKYELIDKAPEYTPNDIKQNRTILRQRLEHDFPNELDNFRKTLGDEFYNNVQWEEIILSNASPQQIRRILNELNDEAKFFARTDVNERTYGKNIQWASEINQIAENADVLIRNGATFDEVINNIASDYKGYDEATQLASNSKFDSTDRRLYSGQYRGNWESQRGFDHGASTPFGPDLYGSYYDRFKNLLGVNRQSPYSDVKLTQFGHITRGDCMLHPINDVVNPGMRHINERFDELKPFINKVQNGEPLTPRERVIVDDKISEMYYIMANVMPWARGSNGISDIFMRSLYKSLNIDKPALAHGVSLDLEAFCYSLDEYKARWNTFFVNN